MGRLSVGSGSSNGDTDMQYIKASELFPKKAPWVEDGHAGAGVPVPPPFPLLPGEGVIYEVSSTMDSLPDTFFPDSLPRLSCTKLDFPELSS